MAQVHKLVLADGRPRGTVIDFQSSAAAANVVGYGLAKNSFRIGPPPEQVLADPGGYNRDGSKPRTSRFDNRVIEFGIHIKGSSQADAIAKFGALEEIGHRARQA